METSCEEVDGEMKCRSTKTHRLRERNENSLAESSGSGFPARKLGTRRKGSENVPSTKRKLNTYNIADIIDSQV